MTRRRFFPMLVALFAMMAISFFGNTEKAAAQLPQNLNICWYLVDIAGIPPHCFPITLQTEWACPDGSIRVVTKNYGGNGVFAEQLNPNFPPFPFIPCPPACRFNWASLNGIINPTPLHTTKIYNINNCCYILTATTGPNGEIIIYIRPCAVETE